MGGGLQRPCLAVSFWRATPRWPGCVLVALAIALLGLPPEPGPATPHTQAHLPAFPQAPGLHLPTQPASRIALTRRPPADALSTRQKTCSTHRGVSDRLPPPARPAAPPAAVGLLSPPAPAFAAVPLVCVPLLLSVLSLLHRCGPHRFPRPTSGFLLLALDQHPWGHGSPPLATLPPPGCPDWPEGASPPPGLAGQTQPVPTAVPQTAPVDDVQGSKGPGVVPAARPVGFVSAAPPSPTPSPPPGPGPPSDPVPTTAFSPSPSPSLLPATPAAPSSATTAASPSAAPPDPTPTSATTAAPPSSSSSSSTAARPAARRPPPGPPPLLPALPEWQERLRRRGILAQAFRHSWEPYQGGWRYPLFTEDGAPSNPPLFRWKRFQTRPGEPKNRFLPKKGYIQYYFAPGASMRAEVAAAGGLLLLGNGEASVLTLRTLGLGATLCWFGEANIPPTFLSDCARWGVRQVINFPDRDEAGLAASQKLAHLLYGTGVEYLAFQLPGFLPSHADLNDLWMHVQFDPAAFWQALQGQPRLSHPPPAPHLSPPNAPFLADRPPQHRGRRGFFPPELVRELERLLNASLVDAGGWSLHPTRCLRKRHEHDAERPAAYWNRTSRCLYCHKCGVALPLEDCLEALGLIAPISEPPAMAAPPGSGFVSPQTLSHYPGPSAIP